VSFRFTNFISSIFLPGEYLAKYKDNSRLFVMYHLNWIDIARDDVYLL